MFVCNCSNFDNNFGSGGASVSLIYYSGNFNNVTFSNHSGPVVRVSNRRIFIYNEIIMHNSIHTSLQFLCKDMHLVATYMYSRAKTNILNVNE